MQKQRWYAGAESLPDGSVVLVGGFVNGGYVNRNFPNIDPEFEGGLQNLHLSSTLAEVAHQLSCNS